MEEERNETTRREEDREKKKEQNKNKKQKKKRGIKMMKVSRKPILLYRFVAARGELCGLFSICVRRHCFKGGIRQRTTHTHARTK